jgi:hypothetical protein
MGSFFDTFLLIETVIVSTLVGLDWLIGKSGRERVKQWVGTFWTIIQYDTLDTLAIRLLTKGNCVVDNLFGSRIISIRFIICSWIVNILMIIPLFYILANFVLHDYLYLYLIASFGLSTKFISTMQLKTISFFAIMSWLSCAAFSWSLRPPSVINNNWWVLTVLTFRFFISVFAVVSLFSLIILVFSIFSFYADNGPVQEDVLLAEGLEEVLTILIVIVYASWPIVLALLILFFIISAKVLRPVLQPLLNLLLSRIYENEQGVLTQVALGIGGIAKATQEILKYL